MFSLVSASAEASDKVYYPAECTKFAGIPIRLRPVCTALGAA
jgi:hypothetical protein